MTEEIKYKDCQFLIVEKEENVVIRLQDRYGFRWFETDSKDDLLPKIATAYKIQKDIIKNGFKSKYAFVNPIIL